MNETYEWLYDRYALPLIRVRKDADAIKQTVISRSSPGDQLFLEDQMNDLCALWGMEAFTVGLQLGLRLMAGQRAEGLDIE